MSPAAEVMHVSELLASLEEKTKRRLGVDRLEARAVIAREMRCAPGTLTNIVKRRVKAVPGWLRDVVEDALLRTIRAEIKRLSDEEHAIRMGAPRRDRARDLEEIEADLVRLKAMAGGA